MRLRWALLIGWMFWFLFFLGSVNGAVTIAKDVVIAGPYGKLTASVNMDTDLFSTYANGTVYLDVQNTNGRQGFYSFTAQSYGNGTFQIRFKGPTPVRLIQSAATSAYQSANTWQQLTYTASQTSELTLHYGFLPSRALRDASLATASMLGVVIIYKSWRDIADPEKQDQPVHQRISKVVWTLLLVITALFLGALLVS